MAWADEAFEDALYDSQALVLPALIWKRRRRQFDATTLNPAICWRRTIRARALLRAINADLAARGLLLREGTLVDAIIAAPSSTQKNQKKERDPEMHQTKKGNQWLRK